MSTIKALCFSLTASVALNAQAFCGFFVATADQNLYNDASQVVLVRDGDRTVVTMNNNFQGDVAEFAIVVPVPTVLERGQINVADPALIKHLDAYSAPRLVEYFDDDPCQRHRILEMQMSDAMPAPAQAMKRKDAAKLGVTIEAEYAVGEYDIQILSAQQSDGLISWLQDSGYRIPAGAAPTVSSYLKQGMKFFLAKVNLKKQGELGYTYLRPLQLAYESPKFMLPIRLGMANAKGPQDLYVYALSKTGRIETRNYRTVKMPSGMDVPVSVKDKFGEFYKATFTRQLEKHNNKVALLEYAWDMAWCDPCAADPLSNRELRQLGVFWIDPQAARRGTNVYITRLHVRYDQANFPEDLMFTETGNRENFQGRYVIRHPWNGESVCEAAKRYREVELPKRQRKEAEILASLTGWPLDRPAQSQSPAQKEAPWWQRLWDNSDS